MSPQALRPWTDLVKLHPDVESGRLTEAVFAIDLGAIATNDPNVPVVNRDPEAFFHAKINPSPFFAIAGFGLDFGIAAVLSQD